MPLPFHCIECDKPMKSYKGTYFIAGSIFPLQQSLNKVCNECKTEEE